MSEQTKPERGQREHAARWLVGTLFWGAFWGFCALFYQSGVDRGAHPHHYGYIWWYDWAALAAAPLVVGALVVWTLIATGRIGK